MNPSSSKRVTMKLKKPNPQIEKLLVECRDEALEKGYQKEYENLNYALINLRKYCLPLQSIDECRIIIGFTKTVCRVLSEKQNTYKQNRYGAMTTGPSNRNCINERQQAVTVKQENDIICIDSEEDGDRVNNTLLKAPSSISSTKTSESHNSLAKIPFKNNAPSTSVSSEECSQMSLGSSAKADLQRNASSVSISSGESQRSYDSAAKASLKRNASSASLSSEECFQSSLEEHFIFGPGSFDIILYIDTCETAGNNPRVDDKLLNEFRKLKTPYEIKDLKVGDYIWICRDRVSKNELVLPHIIERKRMDDFAKSIKDGRYHEQKYRLKRSGIQHITYLIEQCSAKQVRFPKSSLDQAADNTAIRDGLYVKVTKNTKHTVRYLADLTDFLTEEFKNKTLASCNKENLVEISSEDDLVSLMTFKEFNASSVKNKPCNISDRFVRMLLQIHGMTVDKALGIVEKYPTPFLLQKAYEALPSGGEKLLENISGKFSNSSLGLPLSKVVYDLFR